MTQLELYEQADDNTYNHGSNESITKF
jgi:hypothetical protein